ncbi:MAG: hypothetical protein R3331_11290 [Sulfurospirillaceae bacterium]|nr:hypothetical protein [Sulfurospirillaceae bacterium]
MDKDTNIMELRQIKWRTNLSRKLDEFSDIISDEKIFQEYFGEKYVEKLAEKLRSINRIVIQISIAYTILMLSLFISQKIGDSEFEILGYGFKNISKYKEFILLVASVLSPINTILAAHQKYIKGLVNECLKKLSPNSNIRKYYSYTFLDEYSDSFVYKEANKSIVPHGFTLFVMSMFALILIFLFIAFLVGSLFIQINVILSVINQSSTSHYIHIVIISISLLSIILSWVMIIAQLPMPEVDISNYEKLSEIETTDPSMYKKIMRKMAEESDKKDKISILIISTIVYILSFTVISIYYFPESLGNVSLFLKEAMTGFFISMIISIGIIRFVSKKILRWFFKKYKDEAKQHLNIYNRINKILLLMKIFMPMSIAIIYSYCIYHLK